MEEVIIEARCKKSYLPLPCILIGVILIVDYISSLSDLYDSAVEYGLFYESFLNYFFTSLIDHQDCIYFYFGAVCVITGFILYRMINRSSLTVTNLRIVGNASFGKLVDVPINQINSVTHGSFNRLIIGTPSGDKSFWMITNRDEVHSVLMNKVMSIHNQNTYQPPMQ